MNNKGMSMKLIVNLVIMAISMGLIIVIIMMIINGVSESATDETCRNSVILRSKAEYTYKNAIKDIKIEKVTPLICSTDDAGELSGNREEVKHDISELAARCWFSYFEGNAFNIFDKDEAKDSKTCNVCFFFQAGAIKEGEPYSAGVFQELEGRPTNKITVAELYNYLMDEPYNPPVLRRGGTKTSIGDAYGFNNVKESFSFSSEIQNPRVIPIKDIYQVLSGFMKDFSGLVNQDARIKIADVGTKLITAKKGTLFVVVADELESIDRDTARQMIDDLNLNTDEDHKDAILLLVDLENEVVRLHMGRDLEVYIPEEEIFGLLEDSFNKENPADINAALISLMDKLETRILNTKKSELYAQYGINPKSYYAYLANGINYPIVMDDIEQGKMYTVNYVSTVNAEGFWEAFRNKASDWTSNLPVNAGFATGALISGVSFLPATAIGVGGTIIYTGIAAWLDPNVEAGPQHIMITRVNKLNEYCEVLD